MTFLIALRLLAKILFVLAIVVAAAAAFTAVETARIETRFPPKGHFVEVDGGRLHYTERAPLGANRGVVLLIHGASGSQADVMLPLGDRLAARGFRVLAIDRPGLGWSDRPGGSASASPARQAELLRQAAQRLGVTSAIVVAHSLAGALGSDLAIDHPDFVRGLVLLSPVNHPWPEAVLWYYRAAATPVLGWWFTHLVALPAGLATMNGALKPIFAPRPVPDHYAALVGARLILTPDRFRANAQDVLALKRFVRILAPRMRQIRAPTAILTGDHDDVVTPRLHSFTSAREISDATLTILPNVGHSPHWADPEAVVEAIVAVAERAPMKENATVLAR